jgi:hypothetical protein
MRRRPPATLHTLASLIHQAFGTDVPDYSKTRSEPDAARIQPSDSGRSERYLALAGLAPRCGSTSAASNEIMSE